MKLYEIDDYLAYVLINLIIYNCNYETLYTETQYQSEPSLLSLALMISQPFVCIQTCTYKLVLFVSVDLLTWYVWTVINQKYIAQPQLNISINHLLVWFPR